MVGFKNVWMLIISLTFLAACVPKAKQTECGSNEAYNSQLRTCVPIVQGPSAFINIKPIRPLYTATRYKNDTSGVEFEIDVSNPYNQTATIEWVRSYNGSEPDVIAGNVKNVIVYPSTLAAFVGPNIITARVRDANGVVVDSHNFELLIQDSPKPNINTATITPADYNPIFYPSNTGTRFSFTGRNNSASSISNYRVYWTLTRSGVSLPAYNETDTFLNTSTTGTNVFYYGTDIAPRFNPSVLGVGSYILRARMENPTAGEIVDEHQWNIVIQQPPLENISSTALPAVGVETVSYNNLNYTQFPLYNFTHAAATQSQFCVTVDDADGTYDGDGLGIQVKWYLNGLGGDICTKETTDTDGPQTLCLVDPGTNCSGGAPFDASLLRFVNSAPNLTSEHSVVARVFDRAINQEYTSNQVIAAPFQYPISWKVVNKPVNSPPTVGFGTIQPATCTSGGSFTRNNCQITQGTPFTVSFTVSDDFFSPATDPTEFSYSVELKRNGTAISATGCNVALGAAPAYGTQWTCTMELPHFDPAGNGAINPAVGPYSVTAIVTDSGSPVGGTPAASQALTWNLSPKENNSSTLEIIVPQGTGIADSNISRDTPLPVTVFDPAGTNFATELDTIVFRPRVDDFERDDLKVKISLCTDGTINCLTSTGLTPSGSDAQGWVTFLRKDFVDPIGQIAQIPGVNYLLPETLLLQAGQDVGTNSATDTRAVFFKVEVKDSPSVASTTVKSDSEVFSLFVLNYNPPPYWTGSPNPALSASATPSTYYDAFVGFPITLDPGVANDDSVHPDEKTLYYKWFISDDEVTWNEIPRTNDSVKNLTWTPDNGAVGPVYIRACAGDRPNANAATPTNASQCVGNWIFNVKDGVKALAGTSLPDMGTTASAVWFDPNHPSTYYSAYVGTNNNIFVEKSVMSANGDLNTTSFDTVSFPALSSGATSTVKDLSITGTATDLYISYVASSSSTPDTLIPRLRRIDKNFDNPISVPPVLGAKELMPHAGKFGFSYGGYAISSSSAAVTSAADALNGSNRTITFAAAPATGATVTINGYIFTAAGTPSAPNQICDTTSCATAALAAENLADKINKSISPLLQGMSASSAGGVVTLRGSLGGDFLDWDGSIGSVGNISVAQAGKIWIANSRWYIPVINSSLGAQQNFVSLISGPVGKHLQEAPLGLDDSTVLATGKTLAFSNSIAASGEVVIARISGDAATAGLAYLHRFNGVSFAASVPAGLEQNPQAIFIGKSFQSIKLSTTAVGNANHFVLAQERVVDGAEWNIGRYGVNFLSGLEYFLTDRLATDSTSTVIDNTKFTNPEIVSAIGSAEARIVFLSDGLTPGDYYPRVARVNNSMIVSCGSCESITTNEVSPTGVIGVSQYVSDVNFATIGAIPSERLRDSIFTLFNVSVGANQRPYTGVLNMEVESIQSTSVDTTDHFFRPPYVK